MGISVCFVLALRFLCLWLVALTSALCFALYWFGFKVLKPSFTQIQIHKDLVFILVNLFIKHLFGIFGYSTLALLPLKLCVFSLFVGIFLIKLSWGRFGGKLWCLDEDLPGERFCNQGGMSYGMILEVGVDSAEWEFVAIEFVIDLILFHPFWIIIMALENIDVYSFNQ